MSEHEPHYVGFWWRVLTCVIDSLFLAFLIFPILIYFLGDPLGTSPAGMVLQLVLPAIGFVAFWSARSTTPGKMAIGAEIIDAKTGGKPSFGQCIIRYVGYYIAAIPLFLGFIWVAFDKRKQGWHDKLAGTVVVFKKSHPRP